MSNEEKILAMLETMRTDMNTRFDRVETRLDKVEEDMRRVKADVQQATEDAHQAKEDAHWTRVRIKSKIEPNIQLLAEGDAAIVERMVTKEQLDELREDLGLERYRIDVLAEQQRRAK